MKKCNCRPPSGATGQNISVSWIVTSLSGTQSTHTTSQITALNSFWKPIHGFVWHTPCNSWDTSLRKVYNRKLCSQKQPPSWVWVTTAPFLRKHTNHLEIRKFPKTVLSLSSSKQTELQSSHLLCHLRNKERSVCDCTRGVAVRGRRNNICGFSLALRWLNDDMGPFLLPYKVTF